MKPGAARWLPEVALAASVALFLVVGNVLADTLPAWSEIVSALPNNHHAVVVPGADLSPGPGPLPLEPSCAQRDPPLLVVSSARPNLALCAGSQTLPVMTMSYSSGVATWPLALLHPLSGDDTFVLRKVWLVVAALSLLLTFRLVARLADRTTAAFVCFLTATSSPFLVVNAVLVPFETLPWTLLVGALSAWAGTGVWTEKGRPATARAPAWRLVLGALLAGLALATNVKAAFLVAPLACLAWRSGLRPGLVGRARAAAMGVAFALPLVPMAVFAWVDPTQGFAGQIATRVAALVHNLRPGHVATEPLLLLNFASDVASYMDLAAQHEAVRLGWIHVAVAVPLAYCVVAAVTHLAGRPRGSVLAAASGAIVATYFLVSLLLYTQYPGGNYAPLHDVFGIALGAGVIDLARSAHRALERRALPRPSVLGLSLVAAAVLAAGSLWNLARRGDFTRYVTLSTNAAATREAAAYLRTAPEAGTPIITATYMHAGVLDALGHGALHTLQAQDFFARCEGQPNDACVTGRWRWLLTRDGVLPVRVVVPLVVAAVDHPADVIGRLEASLNAACEQLGLAARLEQRFTTGAGLPVLGVYRVDGVARALPPSDEASRPAPAPEATTARTPATPECPHGISAAAAQQLFDALGGATDDGCTLENVRTERWRMQVEWKKDDALVDAVSIVPNECAGAAAHRGKTLSLDAPPAALSKCPVALAKARALVDTSTFGDLATDRTRRWPWIGIAAGIAVVLGLLSLRLGALVRKR